jgi:phosphocarrier protein
MTPDQPNTSREIQITNRLGLHLRPASKFVKLANSFASEIRVHHLGRTFDGKSILDLTSIAAECGTSMQLEAAGPDAPAAIDALAALVQAGFHEDDDGNEIRPDPLHPAHPRTGALGSVQESPS